jgi:hypothetical protein
VEEDRDLFLFQIYTGFYYKDFLGFTKDQLLKDEQYGYIIVGARDKNDNQTIIPLFKFPYAANVIRKYRATSIAPEVLRRRILLKSRRIIEFERDCALMRNYKECVE